jgi:hypothetical protein
VRDKIQTKIEMDIYSPIIKRDTPMQSKSTWTILLPKLHEKYHNIIVSRLDVDPATDCWIYLPIKVGSYTNPYAYPLLNVKEIKKGVGVHRLMAAIHKECEPEQLACHKCDNKHCANPHHIFCGTYSDNVQDAMAKGHMGPHSRYFYPRRIEIRKPSGIKVVWPYGEDISLARYVFP